MENCLPAQAGKWRIRPGDDIVFMECRGAQIIRMLFFNWGNSFI